MKQGIAKILNPLLYVAATAFAASAVAQETGPAIQADTKPAPRAHELRFEDEGKPDDASSEGVRAVERFGACIADTSTSKASSLVATDFRTQAYRQSMDVLIEANRDCPFSRRWSRMKSSRLLVVGAIAERLIERDGQPVNVQLARAAMGPATAAFSPSDAGAICLVRSAPDDVAKLLATEVGSGQEKAVAGPLQALLARCMSGTPIEATVPGLRAIVATAAFRSIRDAHATKAD